MSTDTVIHDSALVYASQPVTFVKLMIEAGRTDKLAETLAEHRYYPFLSDILLEWLERQPSPSIEVADTVVEQVVREVIGRMTIDDLCTMLDSPLSVLKQNGNLLSQDVANLLKDLRLSALAKRFALNEELSIEDVRNRLQHQEAVPATLQSSSTPPTQVDYGEFLKELKDAGVVIPPARSSSRPAPKRKEITSEDSDGAAKPKAVKTSPPKETVASSDTPPPKSTRTKQASSSRSIEGFFSPDAKEKIMTKIFRDDEEDYNRSIALLDKAKDWKQASIYLDALFMRRKVDPYSKTAIRLTDAVYARFNSHA